MKRSLAPLALFALVALAACAEKIPAGKYAVTTNAFNRWVKFDLNFPPVPTN